MLLFCSILLSYSSQSKATPFSFSGSVYRFGINFLFQMIFLGQPDLFIWICGDEMIKCSSPSPLGGSGITAAPGGGLCVWMEAGGAGGGAYWKALRLLMMWFPTSVLRPKARQSTTVMLRGGWRFSFSGSSCSATEC